MDAMLTLMTQWTRQTQEAVIQILYIVYNTVKPCIGDVAAFTDPEHLKNLKQSTVQEEMLETYDINKDGFVQWG